MTGSAETAHSAGGRLSRSEQSQLRRKQNEATATFSNAICRMRLARVTNMEILRRQRLPTTQLHGRGQRGRDLCCAFRSSGSKRAMTSENVRFAMI